MNKESFESKEDDIFQAKRLKQDKEIEKELRRIYTKDGKMPDFGKFEHGRGSRRTKLILIGLVVFFAVLAASAWAGFFILKPYERFGGRGVQFKIEGPKKITSGKEIDLELFYSNSEGVPLGETSIRLLLIPGFVIKESEPEQTEPGVWNLGSLEKGAGGKIKVRGVIMGAKDDKITLTGSLVYRPANFNSEFEKVASYSGEIESIILDIDVESISEAESGEEIEYKIKYRNLLDEEIQKIAVNPILPEQFIFATSTPAQNKSKMWFFEKLEPEQEGEIILRGAYSSEISDEVEQKFQVGFITDEDKFISQEEHEVALKILKSDLILSLLMNGGRGNVASFSDSLNFVLSFKNSGEEGLEDIKLKVIFDPKPIVGGKTPLVWNSINESYGAAKKQFEISWDGGNLSRLKKLGLNEEGTVNFSVDLVDYAIKDDEDHIVSVWAEAIIGRKSGEEINRTIQSTKLDVRVNSNLILQSLGRYFNDDNIAVGSGPLPPRVGEATSYKIFWRLANSLHDLSNLVVSVILPSGVSWENKSFSETGNLFYDETTRRVSWRIDRLPKTTAAAEASFSVSLTPENSDVGKNLIILNKTNLEARDEVTGGMMMLSKPAITTELLGDPEAEGRGEVLE